jgi:hypothetical protein
MSNSTTQFITQMKLRELHRQRVQLRAAYQRLSEEAAQAREPGDRLRKLSDGLKELAFAGQPLHPEVVNLEILLAAVESGTLSPAVVSLWQERLAGELAAGQLRSEFVYLFGALLEEWARESSAAAHLVEESRQARQRLLAAAVGSPEANRHHEVLDPLFDDIGPALGELAERLQKACCKEFSAAVGKSGLAEVLKGLAENIYQPPRLRREARRFTANEPLRKELADALTILLAELHTWDWPGGGLPTRALWTRNKWRLYLDEDLPTACLLGILGRRWIEVLDRLIGDRSVLTEHRARLKKLIDLNAPEVILENARRQVRQAEQMVGLNFLEEIDVWEEDLPSPNSGSRAAAERAVQTPENGSVVQTRAAYQLRLRSLHAGDDYGEEYGGDVNRAVLLVHAEIQLARAAFPDRPLYVVKIDLQDFYASIPHDVLRTILQRLGFSQGELEFCARFLTPPLRGNDPGPRKMRRGVPMGHALSGMLAELLLRLLERHVCQRARVRMVRLVDDICLLTPDGDAAVAGWKRVEEFCTACGLKVNREKSGAVCLGGALPAALPSERPRWGMLEVDERGRWQVHRDTFEAHLEQSRERVTAAGAVLSRVQLYNANVKYLTSSLALGAALGDEHRAATGEAVRQFHDAFFGPHRGILAGLCDAIRERFLSDAAEVTAIPEGWVYWPVTAGGLGLRNPVVIGGQYAAAYRRRERVAVPGGRGAGWNTQENEWGAYYQHLLEPVVPLEPEETKVMKTLVDDFIARGSEVSSGQQQGLTSYWRWILCTYGPQILQRFGTFRFLITELVPLQLISHQRLQDTSLDEGKGPPPEESEQKDEEVPF